MEPLAVYTRGAQLGATSLDEKAKAEASKICKDYSLPESVCAGLVQCIKQGNLRQCFNEAVAGAAMAGCAALPGGSFYAGFCGAIARWLVSKIGTVGYITTPGCQIAPRRYLDVPSPRVIKTQAQVGGKTIQHWDIQAGDALSEIIDQLNPGEYAQVWSDGRVSAIPMFYVGCSPETIESMGGNATYDVDEIQKRLNGGYGSPMLARAAANRWASPNVLAVRDWQGNAYVVANYKQPYWFSPMLKISVQPAPGAYQLIPYKPIEMKTATLIPVGGYPPGSVAVFDSSIQKYRILVPA